jgi:hypothetical protein
MTPPRATERANASQAVVRRGFDEKSGERRGDQLKISTKPVACFRKIFAAKLPELPPANPLRATSPNRAAASQPTTLDIFKPKSQCAQFTQTSHKVFPLQTHSTCV